jgi:TIR domain
LLVSPTSLKSDWVLTEWGAAWALGKKIVPILHRCSPEQLPDRIRRLQCVDFYKYSELIARIFSGALESVGSPRKWSFTQTFSPGETDKLNTLDEFMAWPAHRDPKQGFTYPDPKSKKYWLVYCDSYEADDSDPTLKKRHMVLVHINDREVKRSKDTL